MTLNEFLSASEITDGEFAAKVGVSRSMVNRYRHNQATPSLSLAAKIERATDGAVPMSSWVSAEADDAA